MRSSFVQAVVSATVFASGFAGAATLPIWREVDGAAVFAEGRAEDRRIAPSRARYLRLDSGALAALLATAPDERSAPRGFEGVELSIPSPDGAERRYRVVDSPILEAGLAAKFPELRTFRLIDVDDPRYTGRGDSTPAGFHAVVRTTAGMLYVDPLFDGDAELHQSYFRRDLAPPPDGEFRCGVETASDFPPVPFEEPLSPAGAGLDLRTYRLAVAATGEYTTFHGGTVPLGQAAIVTAMNRVNEVYEHDLAIRMILVANNDLVVYTNGATDPYSNGSGGAMLGQNQTNLDNVIGSANYDIGHVFSTGGGGVAFLEVPCTSNKARGVTGRGSPVGDPFTIDYVAHEMGHQWGGNHSFNGNAGACSGGNRNGPTAYEPGSGSTVMAYAGICGAQDLQPNSDPYFHRINLDEIQTYSRTGTGNSCATIVPDGNQLPEVDAGPAHTIPISTPFALEGSASDADGDTLTFLWEEFDLGPAGAPAAPVGNAPIFRSFNPTEEPLRTFPKVADLLDNTPTIGEILPSYARTLNFRLTAFDNAVPAGGNGFDSTTVVVSAVSGPFLVTAPNTAVIWNGSGPHNVTWNVANTTAAPVSCSHVDILMSSDGGNVFAELAAEHLANDGAASIFTGIADTSLARLRVACSDNIFFDLSNLDFTVDGADSLLFADGFEAEDTRRWIEGSD